VEEEETMAAATEVVEGVEEVVEEVDT